MNLHFQKDGALFPRFQHQVYSFSMYCVQIHSIHYLLSVCVVICLGWELHSPRSQQLLLSERKNGQRACEYFFVNWSIVILIVVHGTRQWILAEATILFTFSSWYINVLSKECCTLNTTHFFKSAASNFHIPEIFYLPRLVVALTGPVCPSVKAVTDESFHIQTRMHAEIFSTCMGWYLNAHAFS